MVRGELHFRIITEIVKEGTFHAHDYKIGSPIEFFHLHKCHRENLITATPVEFLQSICVYVNIDNQSIVGEEVNSVESRVAGATRDKYITYRTDTGRSAVYVSRPAI